MSGKARHFDYSPDEYISGVAGRLRADEQGVYWMICSLIMSEGGPIEYNERRLATLCMIRPDHVRRIVNRLVEEKKLTRNDGVLGQTRALSEVERASYRIRVAAENGAKGGRPAEKTQRNQQKSEPEAFPSEKLSLTSNEQRATKEDTSSLRSDDSHLPAGATSAAYELSLVLDDEHAKDVVEHRRRLRKPLTASAAKKLAAKLAKWPDPNEAADAMLENGWQGFEPSWLADRQTGTRQSTGPPRRGGKGGKSPAAILRELMDEEATKKGEASSGQGNRTDPKGGPIIDHASPDGAPRSDSAQDGNRASSRRV